MLYYGVVKYNNYGFTILNIKFTISKLQRRAANV